MKKEWRSDRRKGDLTQRRVGAKKAQPGKDDREKTERVGRTRANYLAVRKSHKKNGQDLK